MKMQTTDEYNQRAREIGAPESRPATLREKIAAGKVARLADYDRYAALWRDATSAARTAAGAVQPVGMTVHNPSTGQRWDVAEGVCGFAWVTVRPATSRFARWLIKSKHARVDSYAGGARISISSYGQSMQRKEAYAQTLADSLTTAGFQAYAGSRMD